MLVAVQGCCHGSLDTIYASISKYESRSNQKVRLLLLCGDFQALRSVHDYQSLAVPAKYRSLGTFHEYYSGSKRAPVLTLVIGGNHEASNYMWELYHGGWLAENIYYLGTAGSVVVDGIRIVGSSGIYKDHSYGKGHFEKVPYDGSQLRSVYHTRQYDIAKLMQLPPRPHTIFMSHDWPTTIPNHGNTADLLRRKPFFRSEVQTNTLGSPPLLTVLRHIKPEHWFAAHLHVKFAAVYDHSDPGSNETSTRAINDTELPGVIHANGIVDNPDEITIDDDDDAVGTPAANPANPDEITIDDEDEDLEDHLHQHQLYEAEVSLSTRPGGANGNPDEIDIDDDDFDEPSKAEVPAPVVAASEVDESVDLVEAARAAGGDDAAAGIIGSHSGGSTNGDPGPATQARRISDSRRPEAVDAKSGTDSSTKFLALDKPGKGRDFLQFLDIPTPAPLTLDTSPRITFDPYWLAITRALHPYLSTEIRQTPLPYPDDTDRLIKAEVERIDGEGLLVPKSMAETSNSVDSAQTGVGDSGSGLVWEKGAVDVRRVQRFAPTAPAQGQPGGNPNAWYTNPQTEAFCGMLGIENKINPVPK